MEDKEAGVTGCQSQKEHHSVFEEGSAENLFWGLCDGQEGLREGGLHPASGVGMSPACPRWHPQSFWKHWQQNQGEAGRGRRGGRCVCGRSSRATHRLYVAPFRCGERLAASLGHISPEIIQGRKRERGRWSRV